MRAAFAAILTVTDGRGGTRHRQRRRSHWRRRRPTSRRLRWRSECPERDGAARRSASRVPTSTDANGDSLTYAWTFGDGGTCDRPADQPYLRQAGSYAAILTVNDGHGGTGHGQRGDLSGGVERRAPVANAAGVADERQSLRSPVSFSGAASTDANGDSLTYAWTFGDGGTATGRLTSHTYATAGALRARSSTVNDRRGGTDTASVAISGASPPNTFPQNAVLDNFNRANGAPGANWIDETAQFSDHVEHAARRRGGRSLPRVGDVVRGRPGGRAVTLSTIAASGARAEPDAQDPGRVVVGRPHRGQLQAPSARVFVYTFTAGELADVRADQRHHVRGGRPLRRARVRRTAR